MGDISKNFSYSEFEVSATAKRHGIVNKMNDEQRARAKALTLNVLQPARSGLKFGIIINSGFRCDVLNKKVGGAKNSQHKKAEAADLKCQNNAKLFRYIQHNLDFDQLIWEYGDETQPDWVHVSYKEGHNRRQILYVK